jgi:predicted TIM-barrel fold metal-dependent hydrolase
MIIDSHFHVEEELLTIKDMIKKMDEVGIDKTALMGKLVDPFSEPPIVGQKFFQFSVMHNFTRILAEKLTSTFTVEGDINILGKPYKIYKDVDNDEVFDICEKHPDKFYGWVFVNPRGSINMVDEIYRWKKHPAFIGVKAHPFWHRFSPVELVPAAEVCVKEKKPLIIHSGFNDHGDFLKLLDKVPELNLILAHGGFPYFKDTWNIIKDMNNVFVDLSQSSYLSEKMMKMTYDALGPDRCIYGTDGAVGKVGIDGKFDYTLLKSRVERIVTDEDSQKKVFCDNFIRICNL